MEMTQAERDEARTRICAVCKVDSQSYNLNYGASTCLSCRAFFRRNIQQKNKHKVWKCKGPKADNNCEITLATRKRCKKCRLDACLKAGMKPEAVLDEDQFKSRFRKMIKKKKKTQKKHIQGGNVNSKAKPQSASPSSSSMDVSDEEDEEDDENLEMFIDSVNKVPWRTHPREKEQVNIETEDLFEQIINEPVPTIKTVSTSDPIKEEQVTLFELDSRYTDEGYQVFSKDLFAVVDSVIGKQEAETKPLPCLDNDTFLMDGISTDSENMRFVKRVKESWARACSEVRAGPDFVTKLVRLHQGRGDRAGCITKTLLKSHFETLARFFRYFAYQQPEFTALSQKDRDILLKKNTKHFIQYFLGRYFFAGSGYKQHQWLLLCQVPDVLMENSYLRFIPLATFNAMVNLFKDQESMDLYECYAKQLSQLALKLHCNCAMAMICLLNCKENYQLDSFEKVKRMQEVFYDIGGWASDKFKCGSKQELSSIVDLVEKMADKFEEAVNWDDSDNQPMNSPSSSQRLSLLSEFHDSLDKIPFGEDIIQEYVMFNLDEPFSKHFLPNMLNVWVERLKYMAEKCFSGSIVSEETLFKALGLIISRNETCPSGIEQVALNVGHFDNDVLEMKLAKISKEKRNSIKVLFQHLNNNNHLNVSQLETFEKCLRILGTSVQNNDITRLLVLYTLCPPDFGHIQQELENFIRPDIFSRFCSESDCLERVSKILQKVASNVSIYHQAFTCADF